MAKRSSTYSVSAGAIGEYGITVPVSRSRAQRLIRRYGSAVTRWSYGFRFTIDAQPKEDGIAYVVRHGARPEYNVWICR